MLAALLCILIGLVVGFLVLLAINPAHAWGDGFVRILKGGFHDAPLRCRQELANAAPLIMTGLSVAFASRPACSTSVRRVSTRWALTALCTAHHAQAAVVRLSDRSHHSGRHLGCDPRFFKAYFNINEVITSIMFNWIGLYLVNELIYQNGTGPMYDVRNTRTINISKNADYARSIIPDSA